LEFWRGKDGIGSEPNQERTPSNMTDLEMHFEVSIQCQKAWQEAMKRSEHSGHVCLCGHPELAHKDGGLCNAGIDICYCRKPSLMLIVLDIRYFYKATKGPHEAHALSLGMLSYSKKNGFFRPVKDWVCGALGCEQRMGVGPVRMRNGRWVALRPSAKESHKLMCERCLSMKLNGS